MRAVPIPEIPQLLGEKYVFDRFKGSYDTVKQIIGIGYETVSPIVYEIPKNNLLAVCGGENTGKANFLKSEAMRSVSSFRRIMRIGLMI